MSLRRPARRASTLGREDGLSVVEVMVASALTMIILSVAFVMLTSTSKTAGLVERKSSSLDDGRAVVDRMSDDVRAARTMTDCSPAGTPNSCVALDTIDASGANVTVRYRYATVGGVGTLERAKAPAGAALGGEEPVLTALQNTDVTTISGQTLVVKFVLNQRPGSPETVTLINSLTKRNG